MWNENADLTSSMYKWHFLFINSDAKSDEFSREPSLDWTVNAVDGNLFSAGGELYTTQIRPKLWAAINDEINATECEIYRYKNPPMLP